MERDEQDARVEDDEPDLGEDHRDGPPGYDLDEQKAIQELQREREQER